MKKKTSQEDSNFMQQLVIVIKPWIVISVSAAQQPSVPSDHVLHSDLDINSGSEAKQPKVNSTVSSISQSEVAVSPHCQSPDPPIDIGVLLTS